MPNTLIHFGLQGALTKAAWRKADLIWIYAGCVIPDLPWIIQRMVLKLAPGIDPTDVLLYCGVQSSLFMTLILSVTIALFTTMPRRAAGILGLSALGHLLIDAAQYKWGNGVFLMAPFDWRLTSYGVIWPEHPLNLAVAAFGLIFLVLTWRNAIAPAVSLRWPRPPMLATAIALLVAYAALPLALKQQPYKQDAYFTRTLAEESARTGKPVAFDRGAFFMKDGKPMLRVYTKEEFVLTGVSETETCRISLKGHFVDAHTIHADVSHIHRSRMRDWASIAALAALLAGFVQAFALPRRKVRRKLEA